MSELPVKRKSVKGFNTYQAIQLFYKSEPGQVVLSENQERQKDRWEAAYKKMGKWKNKESTANELANEFGISTRQAYQDIKVAENLFRHELEVDVEIERGRLMEKLRAAMRMAEDEKDYEAMAKIGDKIIKATAMDKQLAAIPIDPEKVKPHTIELTSDEDVLKEQMREILHRQQQMEAEDAEFEEID